jgi:hypothetical protein
MGMPASGPGLLPMLEIVATLVGIADRSVSLHWHYHRTVKHPASQQRI